MTSGLDAALSIRRSPEFDVDCSLSIPPGVTAALLGPNGAGKSTVVAAVAGLVPLDAGHVTLAGRVLDDPARDVFVPPEGRRIGVVFQDYGLFPHLTAAENVAFGPRSLGAGGAESLRLGRSWLERLDLAAHADRRPGELSGGQAQRVAVARALAIDPHMVLLDEPLSAVDVSARVDLRRTLAEAVAAVAGPRLLITHDPTEAFLLADVVHVIESGRITQSGTPDEIRLRPRTGYSADLAGVNLFRGVAAAGTVRLEPGHPELHIADSSASGPVLLTIHPRSVALHADRPEGSPRNVWLGRIDHVERIGDRARVQFDEPLPLTAEITASSATGLGLAPGQTAWLSVKATEIGVVPD